MKSIYLSKNNEKVTFYRKLKDKKYTFSYFKKLKTYLPHNYFRNLYS